MKIKEEHKKLLRGMGLKDKDFDHFDGKYVSYEYDAEKGVRIYDPYYDTSYNEYIGVDGWSAWSSEEDTFMSDILRSTHEEVQRRKEANPKSDAEEIEEALKNKFGEKIKKRAE